MAKAKVKKSAPKKAAPKEEINEEKVAVEEEAVEEVAEEVVEEKAVEEQVSASAKNLERSANKTPGVKTETFRAPYEGDLNLHIDRFVSENDIGDYKVVEISPPDSVDDYWQKVIEY